MTAAPCLPADTRADAGFVLVTVLWLLGLLGVLASAMAFFSTGSVGTLDVYGRRLEARAALDGGLNRAVATMLGSRKGVGRDSSVIGEAAVSASWTAETARIDINYAPAPLLAGLFERLGASPDAAADYAARIVGLRGFPADPKPGDGKAQHADETPAAIYAAAHRLDPRPDPHRPFIDVTQLAQVAGLPPTLMTRASPFVTTYSGVATVDPYICAPEVIEALPDMTRERLRTLMQLRQKPGSSLDEALGPAKIYTSATAVQAVRFDVRATLPDGLSIAAEIVVVTFPRDRVPYRIVSWDEETPAPPPGDRQAAR